MTTRGCAPAVVRRRGLPPRSPTNSVVGTSPIPTGSGCLTRAALAGGSLHGLAWSRRLHELNALSCVEFSIPLYLFAFLSILQIVPINAQQNHRLATKLATPCSQIWSRSWPFAQSHSPDVMMPIKTPRPTWPVCNLECIEDAACTAAMGRHRSTLPAVQIGTPPACLAMCHKDFFYPVKEKDKPTC